MQQQRGGVNLVPVCGEVEGRPAAHGQTALLDAGIHVSAVAQQQLHAVAVAVHRGKHESRCLVLKASPLRPNPAPLQHLESEQAGRVIDRQEEQHPRGVGAHALHTRRVQAQFGGVSTVTVRGGVPGAGLPHRPPLQPAACAPLPPPCCLLPMGHLELYPPHRSSDDALLRPHATAAAVTQHRR
jgi:hypothetical protein